MAGQKHHEGPPNLIGQPLGPQQSVDIEQVPQVLPVQRRAQFAALPVGQRYHPHRRRPPEQGDGLRCERAVNRRMQRSPQHGVGLDDDFSPALAAPASPRPWLPAFAVPAPERRAAAVALAVAGATGADWFGLNVHRQFRTMILQAENGCVRLKNEFADLDCTALDGWVCVSPQPPYGFAFMDSAFLTQLRAAVASFKPDVFIIDPWNQCVRDSTEKDYMEGFERVRSCLPIGAESPALGIVAHNRKPRVGEKSSGRSLLNLLSGSYVLASVPRSVFVVQPGSDDTEDRRVVVTCCKNNNGQLGERTVWERRNGLFAPVETFDWEAFDGGGSKTPRKSVTEANIREVFEHGDARLLLKEAAEKLQEVASMGRTVAYNALKTEGGEFSRILHKREDRTLGLLG